MKTTKDLSPFTGVLPYASEIFGVYQPMLGWKSRRTRLRIERGFGKDIANVLRVVRSRLQARFELSLVDEASKPRIARLDPACFPDPSHGAGGSFVIDELARELPDQPHDDPAIWDRVLAPARVEDTLARVVVPRVMQWRDDAAGGRLRGTAIARSTSEQAGPAREDIDRLSATQLQHESVVAGYLQFLHQNKHYDLLRRLFYKPDQRMQALRRVLEFRDPLDLFDPFRDIDRVGLSPIGIVHMFRQYFFEFDTFLGPPVGHVWMSPGATVELLEVSTRRTLTERTTETSIERSIKAERETTESDEIAEAVKQENRSDTRFAASTTANQSWVSGSASASASIDMASTQQKAREASHKHMREQAEKVSSEIRTNFKSTFRSVTETTDTSSKRYVLSNTTDELLNYELRRKLRQVGVQVQDIGTYLCWQTYVDDPGRQLGVARLVHVAKGPEGGSTPPPEGTPRPVNVVTQRAIDIPFVPRTEDTVPEDDMHEAYADGKEVNLDDNEGSAERIQSRFGGLTAECGQPGYRFASIDFDCSGCDIIVHERDVIEAPEGTITFGIRVSHVNFHGVSPLRITANITWQPTEASIAAVDAKNVESMAQWSERTRHEFEKAFVEAARDRINKAGQVRRRKFEDLREEERIVVYRRLVQDMLTKDLPLPDDRTRHVVAELLNTIFDVDKMLYFVAPEWWRPRFAAHQQSFGGIRRPSALDAGAAEAASTTAAHASIHAQFGRAAAADHIAQVAAPRADQAIASIDTVDWGGAGDAARGNYHVTESSEPSPLGSSLGWLLQLDGDDLRNAFLNAPWVKAVIPIRPGKEQAAINWLQRLHVEGTDGLDERYVAPPSQLAAIPHQGPFVTIRDAIDHLCKQVSDKHRSALAVGRFPEQEIDDANRISATPLDKVYEHGFYPLQGGFRAQPGEAPFEVFDQWVEVLPTDQVVPVEVKYDPKTGRQV